MRLHTLDLLLLASSTAAAVIEKRDTTCSATNVAFIKKKVTHAVRFCDFYLAYPRTQSIFTALDKTDTWNACKCIAASAATPRKYQTVTAPTGSTCSPYVEILTDEYYNPQAFCSFYMSDYRVRSPIPGLSVANVQKACNCYTSSTTSSSSSAKATTSKKTSSSSDKTVTTTVTSTTKAPASTTVTSTCSNTALATAAGNFDSGLASWTATASPTAYAAVATGTSYDTSGSAAKLTCTYASGTDVHASICSKTLPVCVGQNYTVSLQYKFSSASLSGSLGVYNFGEDSMIDTISGPSTAGGSDELGVVAGAWGSLAASFEAVEDGDMVCILLQCLDSSSGTSLTGKTAVVTVDNVRVVREA